GRGFHGVHRFLRIGGAAGRRRFAAVCRVRFVGCRAGAAALAVAPLVPAFPPATGATRGPTDWIWRYRGGRGRRARRIAGARIGTRLYRGRWLVAGWFS